MAIDRFQNKDILTTSKEPVENTAIYSAADIVKIPTFTEPISEDLLNNSKVESHLYSADSLIQSQQTDIEYELSEKTTPYNILIKPELDVRLSGVKSGYYSVLYNFVNTLTGELDINRISSDSTELELTISDSETFSDLYQYVQSNLSSNYNDDLVLNLGNNELIPIVGFDFNNNPKVGEIVKNAPYPIGTNTNDKKTTFYPLYGEDGLWVEVTDEYTVVEEIPMEDPSTSSNSYEYNGNTSAVGISNVTAATTTFTRTLIPPKATGRAAKFNIVNDNGTLSYEPELDTNDNIIYYTNDATDNDRKFNGPENGTVINQAIKNFSKVRYYDTSLADTTTLKNVVVKLYKPLKDTQQLLSPTIARLVHDSYIDRVSVFPFSKSIETSDFSPPNFKIDLGNYGKSQGTNLKNWNELLDANLSTSQQIVDKYLSSSFGNTTPNIDYSDFKNFVNYSSAEERVHNFKYKLGLIESYNTRITTLESVSGSAAITNISQSIQRRDNVTSGFDGWEKWMYYETGSTYTHYSSSAFTFSAWPKESSYPIVTYSTTSPTGENYFNGLISSASLFDSENEARLTRSIPASIVEDPLNKDYILFIDMVGHHFDITWSYVKTLTSINTREEHPYDGMPNELLYDVAKSMGWKLTHGKDTSNLWEYALGTNSQGTPAQSGSLKSKPHEQINYEVWRRVVNNIPYLLKSKGSARAVKALIATYGIPQTFLSIKEYGGPMVEDVRPIWEHDKFVYHLRFDTDNYITLPWDKITDVDSSTYLVNDPNPIDTIEIQIQQNLSRTTAVLNKGLDFGVVLEPNSSRVGRGNIHFFLSGSAGYKSASINDVMVFDSTMSTLLVQRESSVDDITADNTYKIQYRRSRKDDIITNKSASISVDGSSESSYNAAWTGSGDLTIGKDLPTATGLTLWNAAEYLSGSIQEIRYWANPLKDIVVDEHTLSRETYHGNSATSSYFDLKFRFIPDSQLKSVTSAYSIVSSHPNRNILTSENGSPLTASLFNFEADDLRGVTEEYYTKVPSAGANNIMNNKVRLEPSRLTGILDPDKKKEKSQYDSAPVDSNQVGVYLSATKMYNEDIYNHTGYFEIDDYIGNPDTREGYTEQNEELDYLRRNVFKKYTSKNLINTVINILARYDQTVFEQIRQTMPARVDYNSGILIEPHILERPKFKSKTKVTYTQPQYDVTLKQHEKPLSADYTEYTTIVEEPVKIPNTEYLKQYESVILQPVKLPIFTYNDYNFTLIPLDTDTVVSTKENLQSIGNPQIKDMYAPSAYKYSILVPTSSTADVGYGEGWAPQTNGYWNYNVTSSTAINAKLSTYAKSKVYFYSTRLSASLGLPSSSSLVPSSVSADEKSFAMENLTFLGCKLTSDSLTTNSPDTPDGKPVIEIFAADANVLIYTSTTAAGGNLEVGALTNQPATFIDLRELYVWEFVKHQLLKEYKAEKKAFRKKIGKLASIEKTRRAEFASRIETDVIRREYEDLRRIEFDTVNSGLDTFDVNDEAANNELQERDRLEQEERDRLEQEERDRLEQEARDGFEQELSGNLINLDDEPLPIFTGNQQASRFKESLEFLKIKFKEDDEKNKYFQVMAITPDRQTELLLLDYAFKLAPEGPLPYIKSASTDPLLISEANSIVSVYDKAK